MNLTTVVDWKSLLSEGNRVALEQLLQKREGVFALLDHISKNGFTACLQDERNILRLLGLIAGNAYWIAGEFRAVIVIAKRHAIGFCTISLWDAQASRARCLKQIDIPSSFSEIRGIVNTRPELLSPLSLHQTAKGEIVLAAPKPEQSSPALETCLNAQHNASPGRYTSIQPRVDRLPSKPPAQNGGQEEEDVDAHWED